MQKHNITIGCKIGKFELDTSNYLNRGFVSFKDKTVLNNIRFFYIES